MVDDATVLHALVVQENCGRMAVADQQFICTYQPVGRDYGDLRWTRSHTVSLEKDSPIAALSWASENELLVAGKRLTLWNIADETEAEEIWSATPSTSVAFASFSPDGGLLATCSSQDRMVKIWRRLSFERDSTRFDASYLPHVTAVTDFCWRKAWYREQNVDNILYTFSADNEVHVWAYSDHTALSLLHKVVTIDAAASIQPRRLSMTTTSKSRFSFILDSRDLARATERALQTARGGTDHALEHLVEIANRSPEVCIILDGRGHMSAWGIENAGLRNKISPDKFNLALVDGVDISLPTQEESDDYAQITAFATNDASASLCVLVHSWSGQIDWYQGSFVEFFDTGDRDQRVKLVTCWSGHDSNVELMISSTDNKNIMSVTEDSNVILWTLSETNSLLKNSELHIDEEVVDGSILHDARHICLLHADSLTLWNTQSAKAKLVYTHRLNGQVGQALRLIGSRNEHESMSELVLLANDDSIDMYSTYLSTPDSRSQSNGYHKPLTLHGNQKLSINDSNACVELVNGASVGAYPSYAAVSWSTSGTAQIHSVTQMPHCIAIDLSIRPSSVVRMSRQGYLGVIHKDERTLSIWSSKQSAFDFVHTFEGKDEVLDLHWHILEDGLHLLAIQFTFHVAILFQLPYAQGQNGSCWQIVQTISTRPYSGHIINTFAWVDHCQLAISFGSQIATFVLQPGGSTVKHSTDMMASIKHSNCQIPPFSPSSLRTWLDNGEFSMAIQIFQTLHQEAKMVITGEAIDLGSFQQSTASSNSSTTVLNARFGDGISLEDIREQLNDNIIKISSTQFANDDKEEVKKLMSITARLQMNQKSMDKFALIYLYHFLKLMESGTDDSITYTVLAYTSMSTSQEALLNYVLAYLEKNDIKLTWHNARRLGLFMFLSDPDTIRSQFEAVARAEYNRETDIRNPVSCSLFYLALDKKTILQSLWRRTVGVKEKEATMKLLSHDFNQEKAKSTALKNAYALLSRRRFEYAAAFFLLAGKLQDAINVCVNQLHDLQLAVAVARVWDRDTEQKDKVMHQLLSRSVFELAIDSNEGRGMTIWARIHQNEYTGAIRCIIEQADVLFRTQLKHRRDNFSDSDVSKNMPFQIQSHLNNDPALLIELYGVLRQKLIGQNLWTGQVLSLAEEWSFVMRSSQWYVRAGLNWHALHIITNWRFINFQPVQETELPEKAKLEPQQQVNQPSMLDDWLAPDIQSLPNVDKDVPKAKPKPPPTQFSEPSADSLLDSFGF